MQMSNAEYQRYVDRLAPKSKLWKNMFNAFWTGGLIPVLPGFTGGQNDYLQ